MLKEIFKGVVIVSIAIPVTLIGMNAIGRSIKKHSNKMQ